MKPLEMAGTAILIVDDEVSLRNTFRVFLQRAGYETVIAVGSFKEAVQAVSTRMFDLIICDIFLESDSGIDLVRRFRDLGISCPVVIVTGYPHVETASDALRLGAFDYLHKPVEKETLLKISRMAIQQYHLEKEKQAAELSRERYRRFLETIFTSVSDSIISVGRDLAILNMNEAAVALFADLNLQPTAGGSLRSLKTHKSLSQLPEMISGVLDTGVELRDHRVELFAASGTRVLSLCISPLGDKTDDQGGAVLVFRDMTPAVDQSSHQRSRFHRMIGASPVMQQVYMLIENIAPVDTSVLITGESGTGKELVVHALHQESRRKNGPLVMVDCTAIPDTLMESELFGHKKGAFTGAEGAREGRILKAAGGTLFLDEIGDISMTMQLRLLRFLQEKTFFPVGSDQEVRVDVRVIAATNVDLKGKVRQGAFREDLYFRLHIIDIDLPPLRDRTGDISLLTTHFIDLFSRRMEKSITGISEQAVNLLNLYDWPGNVRQLEHTIERACILCQETTISTDLLPAEIQAAGPKHLLSPETGRNGERENTAKTELTQADPDQQVRENILEALTTAGGNKAKAARILKIDRSTLYRKIRELHINLEMFDR
ncbi:MAG: sigma 54-interacting transcriptional regulator [Desulforhopalus sp.]